jgi:hypothetical protein
LRVQVPPSAPTQQSFGGTETHLAVRDFDCRLPHGCGFVDAGAPRLSFGQFFSRLRRNRVLEGIGFDCMRYIHAGMSCDYADREGSIKPFSMKFNQTFQYAAGQQMAPE